MRKHYFAAVAPLLLILAACSGESNGPEAAETTPTETADAPQCDSVWGEGAELPDDYKNCKIEAAAEATQGNVVDCKDGRALASWGDYWAFAGEPVQVFDPEYDDDPDGDPAFQSAMDACLNG